jgi:hypothetical protein
LPTATEIRDIAIRHGKIKKRVNAIAALFCGMFPALWLAFHSHPTWQAWLLGVTIGLIWGNAFEYAYHRFLLHRPRTQHGAAHQEHHAQIGTPQEAEFVALISSPVNIVLLFVINGIPAFPISLLLGVAGDSLRHLHWLVGVFDPLRGGSLADSHEWLASSGPSLRPRLSHEPSRHSQQPLQRVLAGVRSSPGKHGHWEKQTSCLAPDP